MSDNNPYETPLHKTNLPKEPRRWVGRVATIFGILFACLILFAILLPGMRRCASEAARRAGCINNARQIGLAILNYESENGEFPPAYTVDEDGNRLHSWRTLILPYIEEEAVYNSIDLTKPWDDPANAAARETAIHPYVCPNANHDSLKTSYMAIIGSGHVFEGPEPTRYEQFSDASRWMMVMEVPSDEAVHWMSPYDADADLLQRLSKTSEFNHDEVFIVGFLDNHTLTFSTDHLDKFRELVPKLAEGDAESL